MLPEGRPLRALRAASVVLMAPVRVVVWAFSPVARSPFPGGQPFIVETLKDSGQKVGGFGDL